MVATRILFALFEAATALTAVGLVRLVERKHASAFARREAVLLILALQVSLSAFLAMVVSFLRSNSALAYLGPSILAASLAGAFLVRNGLPSSLPGKAAAPGALAGLGLGMALFLPLVVDSLRPPFDADSIETLSSMLRWMDNGATPYRIVWWNSYPAFWELAYLPSMVIARADHLLWWTSLKAIVLVALAAFCIARALALRGTVSALLAASALALNSFWRPYPCGMATIKNDMAVGAGFLIAFLGLLAASRQAERWKTGFLVTASLPLLSTKFSGVALVVLLALGLLILVGSRGAALPRWRSWTGWATVVLVSTTGHFYLRNLLQYRNPVYPVRFNLGEWTLLPGLTTLEGTSILDNAANPETWRKLAEAMGAQGLGMPAVLLVALGGSLYTISQVLRRRISPGAKVIATREDLLIAITLILSWVLWLSTPWTAGTVSGRFEYLGGGGSLRYALGPLVLTEIYAACWLRRVSASSLPVVVALAAQLGSRLWVAHQHPLGTGAATSWVPLLQGALLGFVLAATAARQRGVRFPFTMTVSTLFAAALFLGGPRVLEHNRYLRWGWEGAAERSWTLFWTREPASVILLRSPGGWSPAIFVSGKRFQHKVEIVERQPQVAERVAAVRPDYLVYYHIYSAPKATASQAVEDVALLFRSLSYEPVEQGSHFVIAARKTS